MKPADSQRSLEPSGPRASRRQWTRSTRFSAGVAIGLVLGLVGFFVVRSLDSLPISVEDSPRRFARLLEDPDMLSRAGSVARLFERIDASEASDATLQALRDVFEGARLADGDIEFALLGAWWAQADPEAAYRWTRVRPQAGSTSVLAAVFEEWGRRDPAAASQAALSESLEIRRQAALAAALLGADRVLAGDAAGLVALLEQIPDRVARREALQAMTARRLQDQGPEALLAWAEGIETASLDVMEDLVCAAAVSTAGVAPVQAAESLSRLAKDHSLPTGVVEHVAAAWGRIDPIATFEWLSALPASEERSEAVRWTYRGWLGRDRPAALAWAAGRVESPETWLDPIRANYGYILGHEDPEEGLRLLFQLPIGEEREMHVRLVFARWRALEPDAARSWLEAADLPEFRKDELRTAPAPSRLSKTKRLDSREQGAAEQ